KPSPLPYGLICYKIINTNIDRPYDSYRKNTVHSKYGHKTRRYFDDHHYGNWRLSSLFNRRKKHGIRTFTWQLFPLAHRYFNWLCRTDPNKQTILHQEIWQLDLNIIHDW